jgi:hypothetical protein
LIRFDREWRSLELEEGRTGGRSNRLTVELVNCRTGGRSNRLTVELEEGRTGGRSNWLTVELDYRFDNNPIKRFDNNPITPIRQQHDSTTTQLPRFDKTRLDNNTTN